MLTFHCTAFRKINQAQINKTPLNWIYLWIHVRPMSVSRMSVSLVMSLCLYIIALGVTAALYQRSELSSLGMGWICGLGLPATAAAAATIAPRLGRESGQPGSHLLCQSQQPQYTVETAFQHVCLIFLLLKYLVLKLKCFAFSLYK